MTAITTPLTERPTHRASAAPAHQPGHQLRHQPGNHPARRLTDAALQDLRAMLEEQRAFRLDQLAQLHYPGPHGPLSSTDPEVFRSLSAGARAALRDVQFALWRMDEGSYGRCTSCAGPLEVERLEILPQTVQCLPCLQGRRTG